MRQIGIAARLRFCASELQSVPAVRLSGRVAGIAGLSARAEGLNGHLTIGDQVADHCEPETFEDKVLVVRADSTAWATQVQLLAPRLLERLAQEVGEGVVETVTVLGPAGPSFRRGKRSVRGRGPRDTWG